MEKDQKLKKEKFISSYHHIVSNDNYIPSYHDLKSRKFTTFYHDIKEDKNFIPSYRDIITDKKYKPAYGRPRRSILTLPFRYYKTSLAVITIVVIVYLSITFL